MKRRELDRLLGRGRLTRPEKEAILDDALPPPRRRWTMRLVWLTAPLATAALLLLVVGRIGGGHTSGGDGWRAKGGGGDAPSIEASCGGSCTRGATLMFRVGHLREPAWLAAFAVAPSGERIWYFPSDGGDAPELAPHEAPELLRRGVRLGAEHPPGRYRVSVLLLRERLGRDAIAALDGKSRAVVARSEIVVEVAQ